MPGRRLDLEERLVIQRCLRGWWSMRAIGQALGRPASTITREVAANGGRCRYTALAAHRAARRRARRPKPFLLEGNGPLARRVSALLARRWSPEQIAGRLRRDHPGDARWHVTAETIYHSLFVQARGGLARELTVALRTGRARRRDRGGHRGGQLHDMVMLAERPAEAADRAVPGHWEGDLLVGTANHSQIATLVERSTRFTVLVRLPFGRSAAAVRAALTEQVLMLPVALRRSLAWDQGKEMAQHVQFSVDTGLAVYFCDPASPWQRGTNENTNGLLRQYLPKTADLSTVTQTELHAIADELNSRPRKTLGWDTPAEAYLKALVATTP